MAMLDQQLSFQQLLAAGSKLFCILLLLLSFLLSELHLVMVKDH
jgi:hypothetical protein